MSHPEKSRSRSGRRSRYRRSQRGVSDVVATILLLALTVTLFASIFFFVTSFPSPPAQNSNQFQASLQLGSSGTTVTGVTILHLGGPSVPGSDLVYLKGAVTPTSAAFTNSPYTVSSGLAGGATVWNLGQSWTITFATPPALQNITIYVASPTQLLYTVILPGQAFNVPPTFVSAWTTPSSPLVKAAFTFYVTVGGGTAGVTPTLNLAAIPGLSSDTAVTMTAAGPTNEWEYTVASGLTTTNGTYYVIVSGTNSVGQTGFNSFPVTILPTSSGGGGSGSALSVAVLLSTTPPVGGSTETVEASVTYTGSVQNAPLTVSFFANSTGSTGSTTWTGSGPSASISGPSTVTVYSSTTFTIPATPPPRHYVVTAFVYVSGVGTATGSLSFSTATLTLTPSSGASGTAITLSGSGYSDSTVYDYCFAASSAPVGCAATLTFTSTAAGAIPAGVTITWVAGDGTWVAISQGTAATNFVISQLFSTVAAPAIDGTAVGESAASADITATLSTTQSPDVVIVIFTLHVAADVQPTGVTVAASGGTGTIGAFTARVTALQLCTAAYPRWFYEYYAIATTPLAGVTISIDTSGADPSADGTAVVFGVSGANTAAPFDSHAGIPATATGDSATPSVALTTSTSDDLILGLVGGNNGGGCGAGVASITAGAGFTAIIATMEATADTATWGEYEIQATAGAITVSATWSAANYWAIVGDAIVP